MNRIKLSKYSQYFLSCLFCLIVSIPSFSQILPSGGAPTSTGSGQGGTTGGTQGTGQGNQTGNGNQPSVNQQIQDAKDAKAASDKGKAAAPNDGKGQGQDANQTKANQETTTPLSPEEQAKAEFRKKIYGSAIFADKKYNSIPDLQIATPVNYVVGAW